jgi:UDP-N-acetylglucosamine--N-acetylmuramyl-(pentapeptide) pyrophosphoryl-undecaprenol N-acetylglucosamine transferase
MLPVIALAAGGTGGHLFPAESLARILKARGCRVELLSDDRVQDFAAS